MRNLLLIAHDDGILDDEEFLFLYEQFQSRNPDFPYSSYPPFDLDEINESECLAEFRCNKRDIDVLLDALQIPPVFECAQRSICDGKEALCILLRRLSYPCRYADIVHRFAKPVPVLSMITNLVLDYIYDEHSHKVMQWNHVLLSPANLENYANAVYAKGAPLANCFGFIDGTVRPISRPGENQRVVYNGHKRVHALKYQSVALPNGLIGNLFGPVGEK